MKILKLVTVLISAGLVSNVALAQTGGVINPFQNNNHVAGQQSVQPQSGNETVNAQNTHNGAVKIKEIKPNGEEQKKVINYSLNGDGNLNQNQQAIDINGNNGLVDPATAQSAAGYSPVQEAMPQNDPQYKQVQGMLEVLNTDDDKIQQINRDVYGKGRIINSDPYSPPEAVNGILVADISPGATSPLIRLAKNRSTAIIITDMGGNPWPIINYDGLSPESFDIKRLDNPSPDGYVLSVRPKGQFVSGNLNLILKGLPSPVSINFISDQKEFDAKTEIRVRAQGPNASPMMSLQLPNGIDSALLSLLQGVAPKNAKVLDVSTNAAQAWLASDGSMYLRTRYKVQSPAPMNMSRSADGMWVFKLPAVSVVLYNAGPGKFGEMNIGGF